MAKETHTHHHWHGLDRGISALLWWLIIFISLSSFLGAMTTEISKEQDMYESCLDACVEIIFNKNFVRLPDAYNYDRTDCISNCNFFYTVNK